MTLYNAISLCPIPSIQGQGDSLTHVTSHTLSPQEKAPNVSYLQGVFIFLPAGNSIEYRSPVWMTCEIGAKHTLLIPWAVLEF